MPTIQVRDLPEDVYRTFRQRAAAAGMSLQQYVRQELSRMARLRSPAELVAEVEARMREEGEEGYARSSAVDAIRADRDTR